MNPERILEAVYEDTSQRYMTIQEKMELVNFLSWLIGRVMEERTDTRTIN